MKKIVICLVLFSLLLSCESSTNSNKTSELEKRALAAEKRAEKAEKELQEKKEKEMNSKIEAAEAEKLKAQQRAAEAEAKVKRVQESISTMNSSTKGVDVFISNYKNYNMFVGERYGSGPIQSANYDKESGRLIINYDYKNGQAKGVVDKNGFYRGNYSTNTSDGTFNIQFANNGTGIGRWDGPFSSSDAFNIVKR